MCLRADSEKRISDLEKQNSKKDQECKTLQSENNSLKFEKQMLSDIYEDRPASVSSSKTQQQRLKRYKTNRPDYDRLMKTHIDQSAHVRRQPDRRAASSFPSLHSNTTTKKQLKTILSRKSSIHWKIDSNSDMILVRDSRALVGNKLQSRLMTRRGSHVFSPTISISQRPYTVFIFLHFCKS